MGHMEVGEFALVGMGAVFAGVIRAPITSVLIIFEMTGGYALVLPLMIANATAYLVAKRFDHRGLYDSLLEQDGIHLPYATAAAGQLEGLRVLQAMTVGMHTLSAKCTVGHALAAIEQQPFTMYPVVNEEGRCVGLANRARLRRVVVEGGAGRPLTEIVRLEAYLCPEDTLMRAVVRMNALGTRQLPVVARADQRLEGLLTMSDIFRVQAQYAEEAGTRADTGKVHAVDASLPSSSSDPPGQPSHHSDPPGPSERAT
jgi:CIC family chloride channel protein